VVNILALVLCLSGISFSLVEAQTQALAQAQEKGKILILALVLMPTSRLS